MLNELIRVHHEKYQDDIDFWLSRTSNRDPVLELGCGHGRVTIPLSLSGRQTVGVDLDLVSLHYLATAFRKANPLNPALVQADMLRLPLKIKFGAVIIPCNTYSLLKADQRITIVKRIFQLLKPSGVFIVSVPNPLLIREYHQELSSGENEQILDDEGRISHPISGNPIQISSQLTAVEGALSWEWIYDHLHPDGNVERYRKSAVHQLSSLEQYQKEIECAGLIILECLGDFNGSPIQNDSPYLIMICSKN